ncbi:unnamed protein product [Microthlaspi erraticum]|uniref:NYN domain-containing protein n=1 Tax=Microthlaspi erraticum TaxID=1685480 RepID=A0A6D2HQN5_9BRAS|nr:unnamed protein product [Microthlaspi erraticum]
MAAAKTAVFWDKEYCPVPKGLNGEMVWRNIKSSLEKAGYHGPASITAYVDDETNRIQNHDLAFAGIKLGHVPGGGRGKGRARHEAMRYDMWGWAVENEKSNLMVITKFVRYSTVDALRKRGWNVLLGWPENGPGEISCCATLTWSWKSLAAGGEAIGSKPATCPSCLKLQGTAAADQ